MHQPEDENSTKTCDLCGLSIHSYEDIVNISAKAAATINESSEKRGLEIEVEPGQDIHTKCRHSFTNKKNIEVAMKLKRKSQDNVQPFSLRSKQPTFHFQSHCIYCTSRAVDEDRTHHENVYRVSTTDCQEAMVRCCEERDDEWAKDVHSRIVFARDLPAVDAVYHQSCSVNFRTGRNIPFKFRSSSDSTVPSQAGRNIDKIRQEAFHNVIDEFVENEDEQTTIGELVDRMGELCHDPYSMTYMKKKLLDYFGDSLYITQSDNRPNVVTIKRHAGEILNKYYVDSQQEDGEEAKKHKIVKAAAALIRSEIDAVKGNRDTYPDIGSLGDKEKHEDDVPASLLLLLAEIFRGKRTDNTLKITSIGHCIMQLARPRSIMSSLLFGLTMELHWEFGSMDLIQKLYEKGLCLSYDEVLLFKASAAKHQGDSFSNLQGSFCHVIADNVDHNTITIDGRGTYHGMGLMYTATPAVKSDRTIPRDKSSLPEHPSSLPILPFQKLGKCGENLIYEHIKEIVAEDERRHLDLLWKISYPLRVRPVWSGFMQVAANGQHQGKASFHFLPMIDLDPTNMSCVYSTLVFVNNQCIKYNIQPIVTFDQPLWMKAKLIISQEEELSNIILILGAFHTSMSFLGSIGHFMKSSGLSTLLELVYAGNTVTHMLSGKAYARAVRGHFLVDGALNAVLVKKTTTEEHQQVVTNALQKFDNVFGNDKHVSAIYDADIQALDELFHKAKLEVSVTPTGKLWLQYMKTIDVLRSALKAQRTGNFMLYLKSLKEMLPYFAASGHNSYAKSVHLFLQDMLKLEERNRHVFQEFMDGNMFVRRSDRFWGALATDLIIEQVLMRSLKSKSGITHGRGMDETQRTRWLLTMPDYAQITCEMEKLSSYKKTAIQLSASTLQRDMADTAIVFEYLESHDPFENEKSDYLYDISTGIASSVSNVHMAEDIGKSIITSMEGEQVTKYVFKKKNQVKVMGVKVVSDGEEIVVDPQLLFQRLLIIANNSDISLNEVFTYELSVYPPSLFTKQGLLNSATKPKLADAISKRCKDTPETPVPEAECNVLDGGSLLQRLPWTQGQTYRQIISSYICMVKKYIYPIVVFDGYLQETIKIVAHQRRGQFSDKVKLAIDLPLKMEKKTFLQNKGNKQAFIDMLSDEMRKEGIDTIHAENDADLLIVQTAVSMAEYKTTFVIAEDTDILVLLCHHHKLGTSLFMKSEKSAIKKPLWNIKAICVSLGSRLCTYLPFLHALCGCDTTSGLHGIGKGCVLQAKKSDQLMQIGECFMSSSASHDEIRDAGANALVCVYGGRDTTLNSLRRKLFGDKVAKSLKSVDIKRLPPTDDAAKYHSYRVYLQTQIWVGNVALKPEDWGWNIKCERLLPERMDSRPAPDALLKIVRCKCMQYCDTMICSCNKNGMYCTEFCGNCQDGLCTNIPLDEFDY